MYLVQCLVFITFAASYHCFDVNYKYFKAIYGDNVKSDQPILRVITQSPEYLCYITCGAYDSCQGCNYLREQRRCELLRLPCHPGQQTTSPGSIYMQRLDRSEYLTIHTITYTSCLDVISNRHIISAAAKYSEFWLAGRRPPGGGRYTFYWQPSGHRLRYSRWRSSQPLRRSENADCIFVQKKYNWRWDDCDCSLLAMYMCKIK
ncbi:hypothetical protein LSH36_28g01042 [Paralvinella palmiformis]|uniref:C-type lectin domain-containing protein n=1 Tax=Paralvinella palmiformis TaxID=53620 RepID=A0AAD9K9Y6_9ANNE|nr:hypothetical protein LSH36_28g01042 [Paralvinella palmiformis]